MYVPDARLRECVDDPLTPQTALAQLVRDRSGRDQLVRIDVPIDLEALDSIVRPLRDGVGVPARSDAERIAGQMRDPCQDFDPDARGVTRRVADRTEQFGNVALDEPVTRRIQGETPAERGERAQQLDRVGGLTGGDVGGHDRPRRRTIRHASQPSEAAAGLQTYRRSASRLFRASPPSGSRCTKRRRRSRASPGRLAQKAVSLRRARAFARASAFLAALAATVFLPPADFLRARR